MDEGILVFLCWDVVSMLRCYSKKQENSVCISKNTSVFVVCDIKKQTCMGCGVHVEKKKNVMMWKYGLLEPSSSCNQVFVCFRREPWPRDSSCVSSVRGVFAVSPTRTPACGSRSDGPEREDKTHLYSPYWRLTQRYSSFCQAFLGVCDVLTAHSYQLHVWDPTSFGPLLYTPSPKLQRALLTFVCAHVFVGPDCDSQCSGEAPR